MQTPPKPLMVSLSSKSRSADTTVLSRVRIIRSTNSAPRCFSTHWYCGGKEQEKILPRSQLAPGSSQIGRFSSRLPRKPARAPAPPRRRDGLWPGHRFTPCFSGPSQPRVCRASSLRSLRAALPACPERAGCAHRRQASDEGPPLAAPVAQGTHCRPQPPLNPALASPRRAGYLGLAI